MEKKQIFKLSIITILIALLMVLITVFTCVMGTSEIYAESVNSKNIIENVEFQYTIFYDEINRNGSVKARNASEEEVSIIATAVAVVAGVTSVISNRVYSTTEEKVEAARKELIKRRPNDTIIYRMGSNSYYNLTPRPTDTNGLSFFSDVYLGKCVITTRELVNATRTLKATGSGHVLVSPVAGDIAAWIAAKNNADSNPHPYSVTLQQICIRAY